MTNPSQIVLTEKFDHAGKYGLGREALILPSPAEDGSYGTNGDAVFSFTPDEVYIEHNCKYIVSTIPLKFKDPMVHLAKVTVEDEKQLKKLMNMIDSKANSGAGG